MKRIDGLLRNGCRPLGLFALFLFPLFLFARLTLLFAEGCVVRSYTNWFVQLVQLFLDISGELRNGLLVKEA